MIPIKWFDLLFKIWLYRRGRCRCRCSCCCCRSMTHLILLLLFLSLFIAFYLAFFCSLLPSLFIAFSHFSGLSLSLVLSYVDFPHYIPSSFSFAVLSKTRWREKKLPLRHNSKLIYWQKQQQQRRRAGHTKFWRLSKWCSTSFVHVSFGCYCWWNVQFLVCSLVAALLRVL